MKKILFFLNLLLFSYALIAQTSSNTGWIEDKTAKDIMVKMASKFSGVTAVSAQVKITTENKSTSQKEEKNVSVLLSDNKYRLTFGNQAIYCNGKSVWHWNKDAKEVTLSDTDPGDMEEFNIQKLITDWEKNFRPKFIREEQKNGALFQIIDLTPIKKKEFHKIRISINKNKQEPNELEMHFYDQNKVTYTFQSYKMNPPVAVSDFIFDAAANPSVEIIDIR